MTPPFLRTPALRRAATITGALAGVLLLAAIAVQVLSERRLRREYPVSVALPAPDPALRETGARLARSRGCADCHGADFGGRLIADEMPFARLVGDDLTRMPPGMERRSVHERMYLALHHGLDLHRQPLLMMPSKEFASLSAREIEALAAYFGSLVPVERALPDSALGPLGRALLVAGKLPGFLSAEVIDHRQPPVAQPPPPGTLAYGRHAAQLCTGCHSADLGGGPMAHGGGRLPPAANLTPHSTGLAAWREADFVAALRSGRRPDGSAIDPRAMPWGAIGQASDAELHSIWLYLRSLPPVDRDVRNPR
jgi:mono/diheme cytochrome c family protein